MIWGKSCFLQCFQYENLVLGTPDVQISTHKSVQKSALEKQSERNQTLNLSTRKALKVRSTNQSIIDETQVPDRIVPVLLLPWCSRVLPRCQNGPPGTKPHSAGLQSSTKNSCSHKKANACPIASFEGNEPFTLHFCNRAG